MNLRKRLASTLAVCAAAATIGIVATGSSAGAITGVTVSPATNVTDGQSLTVAGSAGAPGAGKDVSVQLCNSTNSGPAFDPVADCSPDTQLKIGTAIGSFSFQYLLDLNAAGLGVGNLNNNVFCGPQPGGANKDCRVRVWEGQTISDQSAQVLLPITFQGSQPQVPETPYSVLLPAGAAAVLGGGFLILRKSRKAVAA